MMFDQFSCDSNIFQYFLIFFEFSQTVKLMPTLRTMPFGDTALTIYSSPFSSVVTKGIHVALLQTVYVRCPTGCSDTSRGAVAACANKT